MVPIKSRNHCGTSAQSSKFSITTGFVATVSIVLFDVCNKHCVSRGALFITSCAVNALHCSLVQSCNMLYNALVQYNKLSAVQCGAVQWSVMFHLCLCVSSEAVNYIYMVLQKQGLNFLM